MYPVSRWQIFVANRVGQIQQITTSISAHWLHVPSADNPADLISRGTSTEQLRTSNLWFHGPAWLLEEKSKWPRQVINVPDELAKPELKPQPVSVFFSSETSQTLLEKFS